MIAEDLVQSKKKTGLGLLLLDWEAEAAEPAELPGLSVSGPVEDERVKGFIFLHLFFPAKSLLHNLPKDYWH